VLLLVVLRVLRTRDVEGALSPFHAMNQGDNVRMSYPDGSELKPVDGTLYDVSELQVTVAINGLIPNPWPAGNAINIPVKATRQGKGLFIQSGGLSFTVEYDFYDSAAPAMKVNQKTLTFSQKDSFHKIVTELEDALPKNSVRNGLWLPEAYAFDFTDFKHAASTFTSTNFLRTFEAVRCQRVSSFLEGCNKPEEQVAFFCTTSACNEKLGRTNAFQIGDKIPVMKYDDRVLSVAAYELSKFGTLYTCRHKVDETKACMVKRLKGQPLEPQVATFLGLPTKEANAQGTTTVAPD
jgi:hypothetical protein